MIAMICGCCAALTYAGIPGAVWTAYFFITVATVGQCVYPAFGEIVFEFLNELTWWIKSGIAAVSISGCSIISFAFSIDLAVGFNKQQVLIFNPTSLAPFAAKWLPLVGMTPVVLFTMLRICTRIRNGSMVDD